MGHLSALLLVVVTSVAQCEAYYYPYYPVSSYDPRILSPYPAPVMSSLMKTTEAEVVTPNPLLKRAIYQGRKLWDCNQLEQLINKAEISRDHRDQLIGPFWMPFFK